MKHAFVAPKEPEKMGLQPELSLTNSEYISSGGSESFKLLKLIVIPECKESLAVKSATSLRDLSAQINFR